MFYASVRLPAEGVHGSETINGENLLGGYLSHGLTCLVRTGKEYDKIFGCWDWGRLPGVTSPASPESPETAALVAPHFSGGVSDGKTGLSAVDITPGECALYSARKAYVFLDDMVVFLGCDIASDSPVEVCTTVNQCRLNGDVTADGTVVERSDQLRPISAKTIWHDGFWYVFFKPHRLMLRNGLQSGRWSNITSAPGVPCETVTKPVFLLSVLHGEKPEKESYVYAALPGASDDDVNKKVFERIGIIANTSAVQAVYDMKTEKAMVVFYQPACVDAGVYRISADKPCMVITDRKYGRVYVPPGSCRMISLRITSEISEKQYDIPFPDERTQQGKSVHFNI